MRVALTGHRPERLGLPENEADDVWEKIEEWIVKQLFKMYEVCYLERENLDTYCGMASGSDFAFGTVAMLVKVYEIIPLRLHCVLPCKDLVAYGLRFAKLKRLVNRLYIVLKKY